MSDKKIVYSTDPKDIAAMKKAAEKKVHQEQVMFAKLEVIFKLEKSGRGGKTVTIMERLPKNEEWLKTFTKELKAKCGVGGTHIIKDDFGVIEIQGDKRDQLKKILESKGIKFRGM
jgi:translation initiation factor 1